MSDERVNDEIKRSVAERANFCCEYCLSQADYSPDPFSIEHILPLARGGSNNMDNLASSCQGCNNFKFTSVEGVDPATGDVVPLYHPREHLWGEHFAWNDDFSLIIGQSGIGRATIEKMRLNRPGVVNLRRVLHQIGRHPPQGIQT